MESSLGRGILRSRDETAIMAFFSFFPPKFGGTETRFLEKGSKCKTVRGSKAGFFQVAGSAGGKKRFYLD